MCGIVGYVGSRNAVPVLLEGLQRLEYRGYDSAGIAVVHNSVIERRRDVGKLINLVGKVAVDPIEGHIGIGHTRWATHGQPTENNAHPHTSSDGAIVLVHNGIVENYLQLRADLTAKGATFASETDTEVVVQLISRYMHNGANGDITKATQMAANDLRGANALVVIHRDQPDRIVAAKVGNAGGVAIGTGEGENFVASDIPALLEHTRRFVFLDNREMAVITADAYTVSTLDGQPVDAEVHQIAWDPVSAVKGKYRHFMQKEIAEQAQAITDTLRGRVDFESQHVTLPGLNLTQDKAKSIQRMVTTACGTSYHSGLVGKFYFEEIARVPTEVDYASEYRYRSPIVDENTLLLSITQSGETADTLAAMAEGQASGATLWSIVNALGSAATRMADGVVTMNAGPEIGVASTKAFVTSLVDQYLMAVLLGTLRGTLDESRRKQYVTDATHLPALIGQVLELDDTIHTLAGDLYTYTDFLYLGRGINYPIALEGALKLKEISYIHAEGYPAGEMKHGPIALIDENMPVLAIAVQDDLYDKMVSQIEQARARGGKVIAVATEGDTHIATKADHVIYVPPTPKLLSPVVTVVTVQLLAYHVAVWRGADVDQPRNLAKSVTVE